MSRYEAKKIKDIIGDIEKGIVILPAMQRNFVWTETKIYDLFDSLMRDYPIGTFLFWEIDTETFSNNVFNSFIKVYKESRDKFHRGKKAPSVVTSNYQAVLDGQQRLTSLYLGVCGVYKRHIRNTRWDKDTSFVDSFLCVDILHTPDEEDKYHFKFCLSEEIERVIDDGEKKQYWVKISTIYNKLDDFDDAEYIENIDAQNPGLFLGLSDSKPARKILKQLHKALRQTDNINYFPAREMDLPSVVDVFVRVNSGGEKLSACDLMLSVVSGILPDTDIHAELQDAILQINNSSKDKENGFHIEKETVLMAGLMFTGADSLNLSKKENYSSDRLTKIFIENWEPIIAALKYTVSYIEELGFIGAKLSQSIVLPIAYYFYLNSTKLNNKKRQECDFIFIRQWLIRSVLKDVFMEGTGASLLQFRKVLKNSMKNHFPYEEIYEKEIKKSLVFGDEQIDAIINLQYGDAKIVPIFSELSKVKNDSDTHVDHIWAYSILYKNNSRRLKQKFSSISDIQLRLYRDGCNSLLNLQLLPPLVNKSKSDRDYDEWINTTYSDKQNEFNLYKQIHFIPDDKDLYKIEKLEEFWNARKKLLEEELRKAFPNSVEELIVRHGLQDKI